MRALALALLSGCAVGQPNVGGNEPDVAPPDSAFALRNQDGVVISLDDHLGSPIIMDIGTLW